MALPSIQSTNQIEASRFGSAAKLTRRQIECVELAGQGKTNWEIGVILGISEETAKRHIADARRQYDVTSRIQVVLRALAEGLVSINDLVGWSPPGFSTIRDRSDREQIDHRLSS